MPDKDKAQDTAAQQSARQQVAAGGPDPQQTKGDTSPDRPADPSRHTAGAATVTGEGRRAKAAKGQKSYVVQHTIVGAKGVTRGTVASEEDFGPGADMEHLVRSGAVREATRDEAEFERLTLPEGPVVPQAFEHQMAEKDREIGRLMAEKADLQNRINEQRAAETKERDNQNAAALHETITGKDRRIAELERQNAELKAAQGEGDPANRAGQPTHHRGK